MNIGVSSVPLAGTTKFSKNGSAASRFIATESFQAERAKGSTKMDKLQATTNTKDDQGYAKGVSFVCLQSIGSQHTCRQTLMGLGWPSSFA